MAGKSAYWENKIQRHSFGIEDVTVPATVYIALYTAAPTDAGGGTEVTGGSYARASVTNDGTTWDVTGKTTTNIILITFPTATANWGTIVAMAIFDTSSAGNLLYWAPLTQSIEILDTGVFTFPVGNIAVTED